ncbi:unnamed protein product [Arctogadus glacialis]
MEAEVDNVHEVRGCRVPGGGGALGVDEQVWSRGDGSGGAGRAGQALVAEVRKREDLWLFCLRAVEGSPEVTYPTVTPASPVMISIASAGRITPKPSHPQLTATREAARLQEVELNLEELGLEVELNLEELGLEVELGLGSSTHWLSPEQPLV